MLSCAKCEWVCHIIVAATVKRLLPKCNEMPSMPLNKCDFNQIELREEKHESVRERERNTHFDRRSNSMANEKKISWCFVIHQAISLLFHENFGSFPVSCCVSLESRIVSMRYATATKAIETAHLRSERARVSKNVWQEHLLYSFQGGSVELKSQPKMKNNDRNVIKPKNEALDEIRHCICSVWHIMEWYGMLCADGNSITPAHNRNSKGNSFTMTLTRHILHIWKWRLLHHTGKKQQFSTHRKGMTVQICSVSSFIKATEKMGATVPFMLAN